MQEGPTTLQCFDTANTGTVATSGRVAPISFFWAEIPCSSYRCKLNRLEKKYHGLVGLTSYPDICIFVDEVRAEGTSEVEQT